MAQHDGVLANDVGAGFRADINSAIAAMFSNHSGATEPATMYAYQYWSDTTTGLMKQRNAANTGWLTRWSLSAGQLATVDMPDMPSLTVTQAGGALTFSGVAHPLTFRSATLASGAVSTIIAAPADLVLPSGGTLGFVTTVQGRIVLAEMNNGGLAEFAICNIAGGLPLDETGLISTTAIDTASDAANAWYSTTARTGLPYKIVGAVDVVNTAGAWGNPVLVQSAGGNALTAMNSSGYGQSLQTVTRTKGVTYYNDTGKTIHLFIRAYSAAVGDSFYIIVGGYAIASPLVASINRDVMLVVPIRPGAAYSWTDNVGTFTANQITESR